MWLGVPTPPRIPEGCWMFNIHSLRFRETFMLTKAKTYQLVLLNGEPRISEPGESAAGGLKIRNSFPMQLKPLQMGGAQAPGYSTESQEPMLGFSGRRSTWQVRPR